MARRNVHRPPLWLEDKRHNVIGMRIVVFRKALVCFKVSMGFSPLGGFKERRFGFSFALQSSKFLVFNVISKCVFANCAFRKKFSACISGIR